MKNRILLILVIIVGLGACSSDSETTKDDNNRVHEEPADVISEYKLQSDSSNAIWDRYLHQGPTKKKMKLFGADVEVDMGEVELNTSGEVQLKSGELRQVNEDYTSLRVLFDMTTFKLNTNMEDKSDDLFKTKEFPESELSISEFQKGDEGYDLKGSLTIADVTQPMEAKATVTEFENGKTVEGKFVIETLDFPLRDEGAAKVTIKDEVTITLTLTFQK